MVYTPPPWRTGIGGDGSVSIPVQFFGFGVLNPTFVRRLRLCRILQREVHRRRKLRGCGHVAARVSALIVLRL